MEFKDLPTPLQEMASNIVRSQLATLDLSTAEKETIDNMVRNVRNAFSGLYGSDNQKQESDVNKRVISVCVNAMFFHQSKQKRRQSSIAFALYRALLMPCFVQ